MTYLKSKINKLKLLGIAVHRKHVGIEIDPCNPKIRRWSITDLNGNTFTNHVAEHVVIDSNFFMMRITFLTDSWWEEGCTFMNKEYLEKYQDELIERRDVIRHVCFITYFDELSSNEFSN